MIRRFNETLTLALVFTSVSLPLHAQNATARTGASWTDPSPHRERYIPVASDVRLEVLDWGGDGPPLVFLTGLGNTAHVYDDFAPRFRDRFHVYAITRRGYGNSSKPSNGYDAATRAADIVTVLDSLRIDRAVFAGHSVAGDELSKVGATYPSRVRGLIYLDAQDYGPERLEVMRGHVPLLRRLPARPELTKSDSASPAAVGAYLRHTRPQYGGKGLPPEAEVRAQWTFGSDGHLIAEVPDNGAGDKITAGTEAANFPRITAPVLAVYGSTLATSQEVFPGYVAFNAAQRANMDSVHDTLQKFWIAARERIRTGAAHATIVDIPHASHYVFLSQPDATERAMRSFLSSVH